MRRLSACALVAGLLILGAVIGLIAVIWSVAGDDNLPNRQQTMVALVGANANLVSNDSPTLTAQALIEVATRTPQAADISPLPTSQRVVYLVAPEGSTGPVGPIGCGSYLVPVVRGDIPPATADKQIAYALTDLFSIKDQYYGQSGLQNTLYMSNLTVQSVTVDDATGQATVKLTGEPLLAGVCTDPLFQAQIEQTALQFSIAGVAVFINDKPIEEIISGRGS